MQRPPLTERLSLPYVVRLETEVDELRERLAQLQNGSLPASSDELLQLTRAKFDPQSLGHVAEIHVVQQQQHTWVASDGEARAGMNRLTIEGYRIRKTLYGSSLENIRGQLLGENGPDVRDWDSVPIIE